MATSEVGPRPQQVGGTHGVLRQADHLGDVGAALNEGQPESLSQLLLHPADSEPPEATTRANRRRTCTRSGRDWCHWSAGGEGDGHATDPNAHAERVRDMAGGATWRRCRRSGCPADTWTLRRPVPSSANSGRRGWSCGRRLGEPGGLMRTVPLSSYVFGVTIDGRCQVGSRWGVSVFRMWPLFVVVRALGASLIAWWSPADRGFADDQSFADSDVPTTGRAWVGSTKSPDPRGPRPNGRTACSKGLATTDRCHHARWLARFDPAGATDTTTTVRDLAAMTGGRIR